MRSEDEPVLYRHTVGVCGWLLLGLAAVIKFVCISLVSGPSAVPKIKNFFQGGASVLSVEARIAMVLADLAEVAMYIGGAMVISSIVLKMVAELRRL